jgi:hypothetical protein
MWCLLSLCVSSLGAGAKTDVHDDSAFEKVQAMGELFSTSAGAGAKASEPKWAFDSVEELADLVPAGSSGNTDDLLVDRTAKVLMASFQSALAQAKANHFSAYFVTLCFLCSLLLGAGIAGVSYVTAAPHCIFQEKRRQSTALAATAGATLGVLLATGLSVPAHGKLTYLILGLLLCSVSTSFSSYLYFKIARRIQILKASKMGLQLDPKRMKIF